MVNSQKKIIDFKNILCILTIVLLVLYESYNISILFWIRMMIELITLFYVPSKDVYKYYFFFLPLSAGYSLYILDIILFVVILMKKMKTGLRFGRSIKWILFIFFMEVLHLPKYMVQDLSFSSAIAIVLFGVMVLSLGIIFHDMEDLDQSMGIMKSSILGNLCMGFIFVIEKAIIWGTETVMNFQGGVGAIIYEVDEEVSGFRYAMNSNLVSRRIGFTISVFIIYQILKKKSDRNWIYIVFINICLLYLGLSSNSMSFILIMAVILICVSIELFKKISLRKILFTLSLIAFGGFLINVFFSPVVQKVMIELGGDRDIFNGRLEYWTEALEILKTHLGVLFFGVGIQDYNETIMLLLKDNSIDLIVHNIILETILGYGLIGMFCFVMWMKELVGECKGGKKIKGNLLVYMPILCFVIVMQTGNFWYGYYYNLPDLFVLLISVKCCFVYLKNEKNDVCDRAGLSLLENQV